MNQQDTTAEFGTYPALICLCNVGKNENGSQIKNFRSGRDARDVRAGRCKQVPTGSTSTANPQSTSHDPLSAVYAAARRKRGAHFLPSMPLLISRTPFSSPR
jgi:hypothetical protein